VDERHLVTPFNAKAMALFPERINGKIAVILSAHTDLPPAKTAIALLDTIEELWSPVFWNRWHAEMDKWSIDPRRTPYDHIEVGAVPIKTDRGWLLVYSHIQNYFENPDRFERIFGIEALLLDLSDPRKIIGRTTGAFLVPEESYEMKGYMDNIVFPSSAYVENDTLHVLYGAADRTVCAASVNLHDLVSTIDPATLEKWRFRRSPRNPILEPRDDHDWEKTAVFNPGVFQMDGTTYLFYRTLSHDNTSFIGLATTRDGFTIDERLPAPIYVPRVDFETKKIAGANSGCEDPRMTQISNRLYMCYTAFDGIGPPRVALTSISLADLKDRLWRWEMPRIITPLDVDDKDTCLLPERVSGKFFILHRIGTDICGDFVDTIEFKDTAVDKCIRILGPRRGMWDSSKVGIAGPPIKTDKGWLLIYHASSRNHHAYRIGAVLLDLKDPTIVLARSTDPLFWPEKDYEKFGIVNNVVFSCGMSLLNGTIFLYYGGADRVTAVATIDANIVLEGLVHGIRDNSNSPYYVALSTK
jgi:predicted GH43/DUF377 family glycosyl hydrolase